MSKSTDIFTTPKVTQHTFEKHHLSTSTHRDIQMQEQHPDSSNSTVAPLSGNANSGVSDSQAPVQAYAKLEGPDFCYYVRTLEVSLGRHSSSDDPDPVDIDLGDIKAVSRRHAKIHYNFMSQSFELQIFGKNGCLVDDEYFAKGQSVTLRHKMIIQIGDTEFSFLLPKAAMTAAGPANSVMPSSAGYSANTPGLAPAGPPAEPLGMHPGPHAPMAPLHTNDDSPQHQHPPQHGGYPVNAITPQRLNLYLQPEAAIRHQQQQRNPPGYPPNPMPLDDGRRDHRRRPYILLLLGCMAGTPPMICVETANTLRTIRAIREAIRAPCFRVVRRRRKCITYSSQ
ncbi:hypothetical protein LPJ66_001602 [Kickxella alabastrina]|uniref:Uncharacterized protein n=1 Tax=Kickxella alabastrina TaxID=61397 RepID=A0ACC1ISW3_9FUNG|nr:hypothetical protein LPJ66_001602 [Kickxella alabastrina]